MKKAFIAVFATAILATGTMTISTNTAEAKCKGWKCSLGKGVATGVGIGVGAAITDHVLRPREPDVVIIERRRPVRTREVIYDDYSDRHYDYCANKYRSYHARSNTYQPYNSHRRRQCHSPWG